MRQASSKGSDLEGGPISRRLREGGLIMMVSLAVYLMISLVTYSAQDPGWSHTGQSAQIANLAGKAGAWLSDVLYSLFGYVAYLFPMAVVFGGVLIYQGKNVLAEESRKHTPWIWAIRGFGLLLALTAGCGLTTLHFHYADEILPMSTGGLLGSGVKALMVSQLNYLGSTVILLSFFLIGITLFTGLSWLKLMDLIGHYGFKFFGLFKGGLAQGCIKIKDHLIFVASKAIKSLKSLSKVKWKLPKRKDIQPQAYEVQPELVVHEFPVEPKSNLPAKVEVSTAAPLTPASSKPVIAKAAPKPKIKHKKLVGKDASAPSLSLLEAVEEARSAGFNKKQLEDLSALVETRLAEFGVQANVVAVQPGPVVTRFELQLAPGVKVSKITGLAKDLARSLSVISVRVVEVIPGKPLVGLEIPNQHREMVRLKEILESHSYQDADSVLTLGLGKDISGRPVSVDLAKMPHLLVAGTTGSGKSVGLNAMLLSILYKATPEEVRLIMIDPKMLELAVYDNIPHLLTPVVTDMKDAANALRWCVGEMEYRYQLMASLGVRNLQSFNHKVKQAQKAGKPIKDPLWEPHMSAQPDDLETKPFVVVVVDEFADMMMVVGKKVEELIARIAQKARAAGIHLILATQRPSVDVITGLIKANIPTRIAFQVSSRIDSRTILDQHGAEQLLGHGDMLYLPPGAGVPQRVHGAYVADEEVHKVADEWRKQGAPDYIESVTSNVTSLLSTQGGQDEEYDELYDEAVKVVTESRRASISHVQRRLKIGYNRAARMIEKMEEDGIVSAMQSNGSREVIAPPPPEGLTK